MAAETAAAYAGFCTLAFSTWQRFDLLALGVAGWMRYVGGVDDREIR